ncbi:MULTISPECIES: nicotinate-nucleotide adenylyltransferase [Trichocoleus]|uniref:nicotinate-nucleotide adenylyltransferase n=1 Tax=Trichocoleus desertorum GB2-A4 TaxID=2933944 RepID=A0ABV0J3D9_9CYAN|nr:nicotinate-nucleotide adenylyltransferase [Trichocoleus sp. FACHB-46]MBD1861634.1 nicotinate-nucleotide adenylyltransferase [Trichocoleus sp. FACHB-46]
MPNIALFGTSADPPTAGHQAILGWLSQQFDYVAVWASNNPFKSHQTPLEHRSAMLQLLIQDIEPPRHNISLHPELSSSRALITVEQAQQQWPDAHLTFTIGADLVAQLPTWYRVEDLLQQVKLLVIPRPGYPLKDNDLAELRQLGAKIAIANLTGPAISSTAYREAGHAEALSPTVEAYIHQEQLYAWQETAPKRVQIR